MAEEDKTTAGGTLVAEDSPAAGESAREPQPFRQRIIAVASGKGGVGKSNMAANLGITLTRFGHRVMLVDTDFGFGNIDLLLGITPTHNLSHVFSGKKELQDVMIAGPSGVKILPAGSGGKRTAKVEFEQKKELVEELRKQSDLADLVFVDTRAGLSENTLHFLMLADEVILVTTPEPPSIMDSYGIVKILAQEREAFTLNLVVNMASDQHDALHVEETIGLVTRQFSNVTLEQLGWVCYDTSVSRAVRQQQPFVMLFPMSRAAKDVASVAARLAGHTLDLPHEHGARALANRLRNMFKPH